MTVRGLTTPRRLSEDAIAALECGDIDALLRAERAEWGSRFAMMADDDDDDDDDDNDDNPSGDDDDADDKKSKKSKKRSEDDDDDDDDDDDEDVQSQLRALRKRMKAADKRADAAEKALRDKEREGQSEADKVKEDLQEITQERDELAETVNTLRLENAFLTANEVNWHDSDTALALARTKGYLEDVVDDDGEVDKRALGKALKRLSKEHAYLVADPKKSKGKADDQDDDDDDEPGEPSGEPAGGRSDNNKDTKAKKRKMQERFPVLHR